METLPSEPAGTNARPLFLAGVVLFLLGPAIYFVRIRMAILDTPWYVPILASVGVLLMAAAAGQRRGVWRIVGVLFFAVVCGAEWFMMLHASRVPTYTGPATPGHKVPTFAATRADGTAFTDKDLENSGRNVLLFFRGRW